jgi:hypothetical protein
VGVSFGLNTSTITAVAAATAAYYFVGSTTGATFADKYFDWFRTVWGPNEVQPRRLFAAFLAGLALICGATALIGAVPTRLFGHDIFFLLDNGWRVINGQRPHLDYYSPWGPVTFLVTAAGLVISGYSVDGTGYGNALVAFIMGSWTFYVAKDRLTPPLRLLLSFLLAVLVAAPYPLGYSPFLSTHAMVYNRYGYALLGVIVLETFRPSGGNGRDARAEWIGGISTGVALSLTLFLKASFFLVAVAVVVILSAFFRRFAIRRLAGLCLGGFFAALGMLAYLHFDALAMLSDLRMAAGARAESLDPRTPLFNFLNHAGFLLAVLGFCKATAVVLDNRIPPWSAWRLPLAGTFFFFVDIALMSSNQQSDGFPICAVFAIMVLSKLMEVRQAIPVQQEPSRRWYAAALCLGPLLCAPLFVSDLAGIGYGLWNKARPSPSTVLRFTTPNLKPLLLYQPDGYSTRSNGSVYTTYVNDGVALLERETRPEEKILTMDMVNPFPYVMQRRPPRGGIAAMAYHYTLGDDHRPSDDAYFGDADIVMVPKRPSSEDMYYEDFWKAYEPGLRQKFKLVAESNWWRMYRRT